jgi:hypothetical protein
MTDKEKLVELKAQLEELRRKAALALFDQSVMYIDSLYPEENDIARARHVAWLFATVVQELPRIHAAIQALDAVIAEMPDDVGSMVR